MLHGCPACNNLDAANYLACEKVLPLSGGENENEADDSTVWVLGTARGCAILGPEKRKPSKTQATGAAFVVRLAAGAKE